MPRAAPIASIAAAASMIAASASSAPPMSDAVMQPFLGADLQIDNLQGWHADRRLAADHTYTQTGSDGDVTGTWSVEDGKLCTVQKTPPPPPDRAPRYCNLGPGHRLGDKWQDTDPVTGNPIFFYLAPGR